MKRAFLVLSSLGMLAQPVLGQAPPRADKAQPQYVKRYDFDNDKVIGALVQPEGVAVDGRGRARHRSLVQPRQSFLGEMIKSAAGL
jgi:hypothetical protein